MPNKLSVAAAAWSCRLWAKKKSFSSSPACGTNASVLRTSRSCGSIWTMPRRSHSSSTTRDGCQCFCPQPDPRNKAVRRACASSPAVAAVPPHRGTVRPKATSSRACRQNENRVGHDLVEDLIRAAQPPHVLRCTPETRLTRLSVGVLSPRRNSRSATSTKTPFNTSDTKGRSRRWRASGEPAGAGRAESRAPAPARASSRSGGSSELKIGWPV